MKSEQDAWMGIYTDGRYDETTVESIRICPPFPCIYSSVVIGNWIMTSDLQLLLKMDHSPRN
jgi:hypothetical protein